MCFCINPSYHNIQPSSWEGFIQSRKEYIPNDYESSHYLQVYCLGTFHIIMMVEEA